MIVGVCRIEIYIPQSRSLKEKRQVVKSLVSKIAHRFNVSVSEIDNHELRQRGTIAVAHVSNTKTDVEKLLRSAGQYAESVCSGEITSFTFNYHNPGAD